jgi:hypothetical protein
LLALGHTGHRRQERNSLLSTLYLLVAVLVALDEVPFSLVIAPWKVSCFGEKYSDTIAQLNIVHFHIHILEAPELCHSLLRCVERMREQKYIIRLFNIFY